MAEGSLWRRPITEWDRCRPWIEAALKYTLGTHTIEDVEAGIADGRYQFWAGARSAIVTEIISYPRLKALNYWLIGGDLRELKYMERRISAWARGHGCSRAIGVGRKGFQRVFEEHGFKPQWWFVCKNL